MMRAPKPPPVSPPPPPPTLDDAARSDEIARRFAKRRGHGATLMATDRGQSAKVATSALLGS